MSAARAAAMLALLGAGCGEARPVDGRRCATPADCETIHPSGIADPMSPDFHGALLASTGWNFQTCATCHGADFDGGTSGKSCWKCHGDGPTACTVCHGQPPATGAHARHAAKYGCTVCHVKPAAYGDVGHLFDEQGHVIARARVTFGGLATAGGHAPAYDGARCSDTYCHGGATPAWHGGSAEAACGSCHAIPPAGHASARCGDCHARVADSTPAIVGEALHVDGTVSLGDDQGTCRSCHPMLGGAHAAHLEALHEVRAPLGCGDCHVVPTAVDSPGHIDHALPEVFPAGWTGLAARDGATPAYDATTNRCADVYCHGGGATLGADAAATIGRQPTWTADVAGTLCGACHGVPPVDATHSPTLQLTACVRCHAATIDATGALVPGGKHLDGVIDAD